MSDKIDFKIREREMLHNRVCRILRRAIIKGDFKPGERLVQTEPAELIGVSRMPIREALRQLESEELVILEPHKGAIVRSLEIKDIKEIYELRSILEPLALRKSMENFNQQDLSFLTYLYKTMKGTDSEEEYIEMNANFHHFLSSKCESPRLLGFIETVSRGFSQDTPQLISGQIKKSNKEHSNILNAILNNEKAKAESYLSEHIDRTGQQLVELMQNENLNI